MKLKRRVASSTSTHFNVMDTVDVEDSDFKVGNSQDAQMLIDPEDQGDNVRTHSSSEIKFTGAKKVTKATAAIHDEELGGPQDVHGLENDVDPSIGYLEKEAGMPVLPVAQLATVDDGADYEDADDLIAEFDDDEFEDMGDAEPVESDADEFGNEMEEFPVGADADAEDIPEEMPAADPADVGEDFETEAPSDETVALVDADEVPDQDEGEDLQFATIANVVHVIRGSRIIASMGAKTAAKIGASDIYLSDQFQDVVVASVAQKGLRKGLVQSGFILAKVKLTSSKVTAKVVKAKVEAAVNQKVEALAKKDKAMEQCLAIAAVGINRRFFKDANNELKANLETELMQAGVRGGGAIVRSMFAKYGVSYAKSILTLANKISAMPEEVRNQYAEALDLTDEEDFEPESLESDFDEDTDGDFVEDSDEDFDPIPASVTAALVTPIRRSTSMLTAGVKTSAALSILNGTHSLI